MSGRSANAKTPKVTAARLAVLDQSRRSGQAAETILAAMDAERMTEDTDLALTALATILGCVAAATNDPAAAMTSVNTIAASIIARANAED